MGRAASLHIPSTIEGRQASIGHRRSIFFLQTVRVRPQRSLIYINDQMLIRDKR
jgi:hypothetical protein